MVELLQPTADHYVALKAKHSGFLGEVPPPARALPRYVMTLRDVILIGRRSGETVHGALFGRSIRNNFIHPGGLMGMVVARIF